ncbi:MAG: hypothetical protein RR052_06975 [Oscillospiraceae bacterium]
MNIYELSNFKKNSYNNEYEYFKCNSCGCLQQCQINDIPHSLSSTSNTAGETYLKTGFSTEKNPLNILLQIKKDLPKNGEYCITVPILDSLGYRIYKENWFGCDAPRNVFIYTKKSMKILCAAAGLSIKKVIFEKTSDSGFYKLSNDITPGAYVRKLMRLYLKFLTIVNKVLPKLILITHQSGNATFVITNKIK